MTDQTLSRVDKFLAGMTAKPVSRGNLVFALDATASRERTWDTAAQLQVQMFREVAIIGSLDVQLVYFRGMTGVNAECKASGWVGDPMALAKLMAKIRCETGYTQIGRVLSHALREATQRKINAMVFVGDACEENRDQLIVSATELTRTRRPGFHVSGGERSNRAAALPGNCRTNTRGVSPVRSGQRSAACRAPSSCCCIRGRWHYSPRTATLGCGKAPAQAGRR